MILNKLEELGRFILGTSLYLDFTEPSPVSLRIGTRELRERILKLSVSDARRLGVNKSTLHYLRKRARSNRRLRVYASIQDRLYASNVSHE